MLTCVHQREQPRREDCSFIPKFRTPDISVQLAYPPSLSSDNVQVTLHRSIEPWTRSFSQPENAHKLSCLHHRHPLVDSGTILTHLTESYANTPYSFLALNLSQIGAFLVAPSRKIS